MITIPVTQAALALASYLAVGWFFYRLGVIRQREETDRVVDTLQSCVRQRTDAQEQAHRAREQVARIRAMLRRRKQRQKGLAVA